MAKYLLRTSIAFLTLVMFLSLASCGGTPASSQPPVSTTPQQTITPTPTPAVTTEPSPPPVTTPAVTTPAATITPSGPPTTTPISPADTADLQPFKVDGGSVIIADTSSKDYHDYKIKAGITNAGAISVGPVTVSLHNSTTKLYTWNIDEVDSGENVILETTVGEILEQSEFVPGSQSLYIYIYVSGNSQEISKNNKSATESVTIAPPPVERGKYTSDVAKMVRDSIDNSTWYTEENEDELVTIVKDVLKDARIQWSMVTIEVIPFDEFNEFYSDTYGDDEQEKKEFKERLEQNTFFGYACVWGTTGNLRLTLREGTLIQLLPPIFSELGAISYGQVNYPAYYAGWSTGPVDLVRTLLNTYGFSILRDNYGFGGLTNISCLADPLIDLSIDDSMTLKRVWALAEGAGYPDGDVPSSVLLGLYLRLINNQTPLKYMENLDKIVELLDTSEIDNIIRWRLVNKDITFLPAAVASKLDPSGKSVSFDSFISYQYFILLPW